MDKLAIYQQILFGVSLLMVVPLKILISYYPKKTAFLPRLLIGAGQIACVTIMSIDMYLYVLYLSPETMGTGAAIVCMVCGGLVGAFIHVMNLLGEQKRKLTEMQKAELQDL